MCPFNCLNYTFWFTPLIIVHAPSYLPGLMERDSQQRTMTTHCPFRVSSVLQIQTDSILQVLRILLQRTNDMCALIAAPVECGPLLTFGICKVCLTFTKMLHNGHQDLHIKMRTHGVARFTGEVDYLNSLVVQEWDYAVLAGLDPLTTLLKLAETVCRY